MLATYLHEAKTAACRKTRPKHHHHRTLKHFKHNHVSSLCTPSTCKSKLHLPQPSTAQSTGKIFAWRCIAFYCAEKDREECSLHVYIPVEWQSIAGELQPCLPPFPSRSGWESPCPWGSHPRPARQCLRLLTSPAATQSLMLLLHLSERLRTSTSPRLRALADSGLQPALAAHNHELLGKTLLLCRNKRHRTHDGILF